MGLQDIQDENAGVKYLVIYDKSDFTKIDVVYLDGFKYKGNSEYFYTLTQIQEYEE